MAKTNFNINKTDVYYTLINNEVYALRFKALLVNIPSLSERELYIDKSDNNTGINNMGPVILRGNKMYPYYLNNSKMVLFDRQTDRKFSNIGIDYIAIEIAPLGEERVWKRWGNNPVFDLLEGKFLFDEDLLEHAYSTEEECYENNSIAVHLFMNDR